MEQIEKKLSGPVGDLLAREGYALVMPSPHGNDIVGKGEFGMEIPALEKVRLIDIVAARWDGDRHVKAVAVECKRTVWAVYDALGQAVQYQSVFDEVYLATPVALEKDGIARSTLVDLGLGHITADMNSGAPYVSVAPARQFAARFEPHRKDTSVHCRLALGLAFLEIADHSNRLRYGFWQTGRSVWFAEEVAGHLQWNCFCQRNTEHDAALTYQMGGGINVERTEDVKRICDAVSGERLDSALRHLPSGYLTEVRYLPTPRAVTKQEPAPWRVEAGATSTEAILDRLRACPRNHRPQLSVTEYWPVESPIFTRPDFLDVLKRERQSLESVMEALQSCYD
jgi:hypothetical protein